MDDKCSDVSWNVVLNDDSLIFNVLRLAKVAETGMDCHRTIVSFSTELSSKLVVSAPSDRIPARATSV